MVINIFQDIIKVYIYFTALVQKKKQISVIEVLRISKKILGITTMPKWKYCVLFVHKKNKQKVNFETKK